MEKITKREMYTAIMNGVATGEFAYTAEEISAFCANEIALLDKKAIKAKENAAKKRAEGDELTEAVLAVLTPDFEPIADIAARVDFPDATVAKITNRLSNLYKAGKADKAEIEIPATETSKKRRCVAYALAVSE